MNARTDAEYLTLIATLKEIARAALPRYGLPADSRIRLLSHSENTVFEIVDPRSVWRGALRIHRPNYQTRNALQSELDWMAALGDAGIDTPCAVTGLDGEELQDIAGTPIGPRSVALFEWINGEFPDERELEPSMRRLGELSARMHAQSKQWCRPAYFERFTWDHDDMVGDRARWGRWRAAPGLLPEHIDVLDHTERLLRLRLNAFGRTPDRFGLIHADLRIANLLVDGERTTIIDFDDSGLGWFLHDMATGLSFIEHRVDRHRLMDEWAEGYVAHGTLGQTERDEFPTFLMQRRLQLLAWMGSHAETDLARSLGDQWVAETAELGRDFLNTMG
ncbi:phosphotransferase [Paraburkholderia sp. JHI2823]|uniref:phosphotransferase enzyme family protein n=1 Tax=Paraburkholderia sp. JHI2823 TaxID=3112960 RepID=UPI00316B8FD4